MRSYQPEERRDMCPLEDEGDWEITSEGLYVATRGFLMRRGYCCANRCRHCPYINWHGSAEWQPIAPGCVRRMRVSAKAVAGAHLLLQYHEQQLRKCRSDEREWHQEMVEHYNMLLVQWGVKR